MNDEQISNLANAINRLADAIYALAYTQEEPDVDGEGIPVSLSEVR